MSTNWYILDTTHVDYPTLSAACSERHYSWTGTLRVNIFSMVYSDDNSEVIVKVPEADDQWKIDNGLDSVGGAVLAIYDRSNHYIASNLLITSPNWSNTRE